MKDVTEYLINSIVNGSQRDFFVNDMYNSTNSYQDVVDSGRLIFAPDDDEFFLDIDSLPGLKKFMNAFQIFYTMHQPKEFQITILRSKSPQHYHIVLRSKDFKLWTFEHKLQTQAMLGSDPVKEMLSQWRVYRNMIYPCLLFSNLNIAAILTFVENQVLFTDIITTLEEFITYEEEQTCHD